MNTNAIVGIRYVGKKDQQEDTVCKTGAIWTPGQVHNFGGELAKALLVHTDSFAIAPISADGGTFLTMGKGRALNKQHDVAAFINLNGMSVDQLVHFARRELDRVVQVDGKDEMQIRREVLSLMTNHSLDLEAERKIAEKAEDGRTPITFMATAEEYAALNEGTVKLALVPTEVMPADITLPADGAQDGAEGSGSASASDAGKNPEGGGDGAGAQPPTLAELLGKLEKPQLMDFARQEGVTFSNNFTAEKLRERIFAELTAREIKKDE
jgi:hypothetical protein